MATSLIRRLPARLWPAAMAAARLLFPPGNAYGVFSYGISRKMVAGVPRSYLTFAVHVRRKRAVPRHPVPELEFEAEGRRYRLRPDVVATGGLPEVHAALDMEFSGLHAGAPIAVGPLSEAEAGGVACLLGLGGEEPTHLVTAGHLFAPDDGDQVPVYTGAPGSSKPELCGRLVENLLDSTATFEFQIDAALVKLTKLKWLAPERPAGVPRLRKVEEVLHGASYSAQTYQPTAGTRSAPARVELLPNVVHMPAPVRGTTLQLADLITSTTEISVPGDSGTILFSRATGENALGSCVGRLNHSTLFEPLSRALLLFRRTLPRLALWRSPS